MTTMGENNLMTMTYKLKAAETTQAQYTACMLDLTVDGQVINPTGDAIAGERVAGILRESTLEAGAYGTFATSGLQYVLLCGTVAVGDKLCVGSTAGSLRKHVVGTDNNVSIVGQAQQSGVTGDVVVCFLSIPTEYHT